MHFGYNACALNAKYVALKHIFRHIYVVLSRMGVPGNPMKHVFSPFRKYAALPAKSDATEEAIQTMSRVAGPLALLIGYAGAFALFWYLF